MCGLVGVATTYGRALSLERAGVEAMRDRLAHRGPDGAGLWWGEHIALGHRRLAVVGTGPEGHQPMVSACGQHVLAYNGELYNDVELRRALGLPIDGPPRSDTQTVLELLRPAAHRRPGGERVHRSDAPTLDSMRGMYALASYDRVARVLTLARDPLGIKPLVYWLGPVPGGGQELAFASELPALLAHPHVPARPDWAVASAYLTTIRTTLGPRTMFEGIRTLEPGERIEFDLSGDRISIRRRWRAEPTLEPIAGDPAECARHVVADSVRRHLRSDVPICALLSGGLDSTIVCAEARPHVDALHTYCVGARPEGGPAIGPGAGSPDFEHAAAAADRFRTHHTDVVVTRAGFVDRWAWMVDRLALPLSTPNEVAIHEVAAAVREAGQIVALSGEGADELFGGYDRLLSAMARWGEAALSGHTLERLAPDAGEVALDQSAWVPRASKGSFFRPAMWEVVEHDAEVVRQYREGFAGCVERACDSPPLQAGGAGPRAGSQSPVERLLQGTLVHQRRVNLVGLLARLDGATMLAGVEGRTPLADTRVAAFAERLAMREKFRPAAGSIPPATKVVLRRAYEGAIPGAILNRAKASFPLPFQSWMGDSLAALDANEFIASMFEPAAIDLVRADPARSWNLAWPMLNLAMWGRRWTW